MTSTATRRRRNRLLRRVPALLAAIACLVATGSPQLLGNASAATGSAATTPVQPVPASAKAQNGLDATSSVAPSSAGGTSAPAASTATPTTTYAPSSGAALPSTTPGAAPSTTPGAAASTPTVSTPATSAARPATPAQGRTTGKKGDRALSTGAIVIAALAALLVLVCAAWGLARLTAFEPRWLISLRHSMAEAGFRASATWSEFTDWVRLGH